MNYKSVTFLLLCHFFTLCAMDVNANQIYMKTNPAAWRLQNYLPGQVVAWYTASPCTNGQLVLVSGATEEDKNRFWSTVLAAKMSGKDIYVYYDTESTPGACIITSFGVDTQ